MELIDIIKERVNLSQAKEAYDEFCSTQRVASLVALTGEMDIFNEFVDYIYCSGKHYIFLKKEVMLKEIQLTLYKQSSLPILAFDKKVKLNASLTKIAMNDAVIKEMVMLRPKIKKLIFQNMMIYQVVVNNGKLSFSKSEIFDINHDNAISDYSILDNGKKVDITTRYVIFEYENRQVIFNVYVENEIYYTLTKKDSNKIKYIQSGKECTIYDGKGNVFTTTIEIMEDNQVDWLFSTLESNNGGYFKENKDLVALCFKK